MRLQKGIAPPIAIRNAEGARLNIKAKYDAINSWLERRPVIGSDGFDVEIPRTKRQFNNWRCLPGALGGDIPKIELLPNSNETLNKLPLEMELVQSLLRDIEVYEKKAKNSARPARLSVLERKLTTSEKLRSILEREIKSYMVQNDRLTSEIRRLKAEQVATIEKAQASIAALEIAVQQERENARLLARTLANQSH